MRFDLEALDQPPPAGEGGPLRIPIDSIDEDPAQPRREFDEASLQELAATIAERGVRQPVSVRRHPEAEGRWLLNFGARRLRASRLAGQHDIPAFVDETADSYDQVIENEQREALRPMDLALFVKGQLQRGLSQAEVARRLGKSRAYITYVCALIDPPDWLMTLYRDGRCRGVRELYDLRRLHEAHAHEVQALLSTGNFVSRGEIAKLQGRLEAEQGRAERSAPAAGTTESMAEVLESDVRDEPRGPAARTSQSRASGDLHVHDALILLADVDGTMVRVVMDDAPPSVGDVYVETLPDRVRRSIAMTRLERLRIALR
jgi:ParB family transcriptional regulator, chromosome partitioning protein